MFFDYTTEGAIMICAEEQLMPSMVEIAPPEGFDPERMYDWRIVDGSFVYDPKPEPEPEPESQPTTEERISELEEALELLLSGVTE